MRNRITSLLLALIISLSLLPTLAHAGISVSGGGAGAGGSVGSGTWSQQRQGLRITIVDKDGNYALKYGSSLSLDLLYNWDNFLKNGIYVGGCKLANGGTNPPIIDTETIVTGAMQVSSKINCGVIAFDDFYNAVDENHKPGEKECDWVVVWPNTAPGQDIKRIKNELGKTHPFYKSGDNWILQGEKIRNSIYGGDEKALKPADNALIYALFSTYHRTKGTPVWIPTESAAGQISTVDLKNYKLGFGSTEKVLDTITLMQKYNFSIVVEPIIWTELRQTNGQYSGIRVYGTPTNLAYVITDLINNGTWWDEAFAKGGGDPRMFRASRHALHMTVDRTLGNGTRVIKAPAEQHNNSYWVTNTDLLTKDLGWAMHLYVCGAPDGTSTYDEPQGSNPAPAPDPLKLTPPANPDKDKINIIKVYRDKIRDGDKPLEIKHKGTYERTGNPGKIQVEDEPDYRLKEWYTSPTHLTVSNSTTWEEVTGGASKGTPSGTSTQQIEVKEPNTTLYLLLEKETNIPPPPKLPTNLVITESQVTKAIETMDASITDWGPRTMNFMANSLHGSCPEIVGYDEDGDPIYCGAPYELDDTSWSYNHRNQAEIDQEIHAFAGVFMPENVRGDDATGTRGTLSTYYNSVNTFNYKLVIWRGKDIPTTAGYKESPGHVLNALTKRYGKTPQGDRFNGTNDVIPLDIDLTRDLGKGDYRTTSVTDHGYVNSADHKNINTLNYKANVTVEVYWGKTHKKGDATVGGTMGLPTNLLGKPSSPKYSSGTMRQSNGDVAWYPYIRMTYQVKGDKEPKRTNVNILSQWLAEVKPNDYVEAAWVNTKDHNINLKSPQWSLHNKATSGDKGWNQPNRVLPGGALYTLDTQGNKTWASIVTWQPYLEDEIISKVVTKGQEFTLAATEGPHKAIADSMKNALDNWRVVQYVKNYNKSNGSTPDVNSKTIMAFDGIKVAGGGESLNGIGLSGKSSTEDKYYMKTASGSDAANEGDLDIISTLETIVRYKVTSDIEGKVHVFRARDNQTLGSGSWSEIFTIQKNQGPEVLSGEALQLDQRTKVITNLCTAIERNTGKDKSATWAKSDGKWYNEAFDGICYIRRETSYELGFAGPAKRTAALDPALCPVNIGQSDLFSKAFISQFFTNNKSDAYTGNADGYVGQFNGRDVILPGVQEMFMSMPFSIPNVNVQDLN